METLKLSLSTFQPEKCYAPYLNTPRSLEACRINGINPVELVEIPFTEFQKDHPNDLDTANRRFERVDGARRRVLAAVMKDWRHLCEISWKPPETKIKRNTEAIVDVHVGAHCKLLEIQAQKFRKIEEDTWTQLQRNLRLEIVRADAEQRNNDILLKHEDLENQNEAAKRELKAKRDAQIAEQVLRAKEEEERQNEEIRREQEEFNQQAKRKLEERLANRAKERQMREKREAERVARDNYTKQMKDSIIANNEQKLLQKQKIFEMREKSDDQRVKETKERRERELEERRRANEQRIAQTREEQRLRMAEVHQQIMSKLEETERHRLAVEEARQQNKKLTAIQSNESNERMLQIKDRAMQQMREKAEATERALRMKDELARQELQKVQEAQERRRTIKALRQEAFAMNALREKKKEDYRLSKVKKSLQDKEERLQAIRTGFSVLSSMRNSMKDIMEKTNNELKSEMDHLRHISDFSPNKVVQKAMHISQQVLFPRLERTFGFAEDEAPHSAPRLFDPQSTHFSFDLGERPNTAAGVVGDADAQERAGTARGRSSKRHTRHPPPTLKIQLLGEDKLKSTLLDSMRKVEEMRLTSALSRSGSPDRSPEGKSHSPNHTRGGRQGDGDEDVSDEEGAEGPAAILHLPDEHPKPASSPSHAKALPVKLAPGKYVGKSALARSAGEDTKLPLFPFTAGAEFDRTGEGPAAQPKTKTKPATAPAKSRKPRNDVNEKAKFLPLPAGKFRREFSHDHPFAAGGRGKYAHELDQGLTPQGLPLEPEKKVANSVEDNVKDAVELAEKVEKLTYAAQASVVSGSEDVDRLRKDMNSSMKALLEEERAAEEERLQVLAGMTDAEERRRLEAIFAEERRRASEKIVAATRDYDKTIKQAMLKTLNLGPAAITAPASS